MAKVGIIGSGFGGLSAAIHAAHAGHEVTVYEKNDQLGGRAGVFEKDGFRWDMGPSWYLMPDVFEEFFKKFDKKREDYFAIEQLDPSYKVYFKGTDQIVDVYQSIEKNREAFEAIEPGSTDKLHKYVKRAKYQYEVAMKEFVPKNYDSIFDFFNRKMAIHGVRLRVFEKMEKYVKRWFKTSEMQKIMQYPLVFLGTAPGDAPALYNIMTYVDFGMGVFYPEGGIRSIIDALVNLAKEFGVTFHTNSEVKKIPVENGKAIGLVVGEQEISFDYVISNADYHWSETQLLDTRRQTYPESYWKDKVMAPSAFILYLGVEGELSGLDHHTLIFAEDWEENFAEIFDKKTPPKDPSLYVCCPSKTDSTTAPEGHENLFVLVPFPPGILLNETQKKAYKMKVIKYIEDSIGEKFADRIVQERMFTGEDFQKRYHAFQGSALGLAHTLWQTALLRPNTKSKKVKNLFYSGGYTNPGIGMPMCLISGGLAFERIDE